MKAIRLFAWITVLVLLIVTAGGARSQGTGPQSGDSATGTVAPAISFQGRLIQPSTAAPLSGTYDLAFTLWSADWPGGTQYGAEVARNGQSIANGLYSTQLAVDPTVFKGQELWLQIRARATGGVWETLAPRIQVLPTAYALSLRPGAQMQGAPTAWTDGWVLNVSMDGSYPSASAVRASSATGTALYGTSSGGYGLYGYSDTGFAVYGVDAGSAQGRGYAGYFSSANGVGVFANSDAQPYYTNMHAPAVSARSANGVGVYARGRTYGVRGEASTLSGVFGSTEGTDPESTAEAWGTASGTVGIGVRGARYGLGAGVKGTTSGATSGAGVIGESVSFVGVWAESDSDNALQANTGNASHNYGVFTADNIWSLNYHLMGAVMQVVQNAGADALEPGEVVVFRGAAAPIEKNGPPVIQVAKAEAANSTAVAGVVHGRFNIEAVTGKRQSDGANSTIGAEVTPDGTAGPGEYLLMVVQGPAVVKISGQVGTLQPGDLLSSAGRAGTAGKAATLEIAGITTAIPGTVFGKALEAPRAGQERLYAFVTLQ